MLKEGAERIKQVEARTNLTGRATPYERVKQVHKLSRQRRVRCSGTRNGFVQGKEPGCHSRLFACRFVVEKRPPAMKLKSTPFHDEVGQLGCMHLQRQVSTSVRLPVIDMGEQELNGSKSFGDWARDV